MTKKQKLKMECVKIATQKKLAKHPYCVFCGKKATTCHHFIRQSRSNYLRCDDRNLIPICQKCHYRLHNGYESVMTLILRKKLGDEWADSLIRDSRKTIKDNLTYWRKMKDKLLKK